jgi:hypothetical protein
MTPGEVYLYRPDPPNPYERDHASDYDLTESEAKAAHDARALERGLARRENREVEEEFEN